MPVTLGTGLAAREIADIAVAALHDEADLTPKPGLVDRRGGGAHDDMTRDMLHASADALHPALAECADAAHELAIGPPLRARIGAIGRSASAPCSPPPVASIPTGVPSGGSDYSVPQQVRVPSCTEATVTFAARLARLDDPAPRECAGTPSPGARARHRFGARGAPGQAQAGFPHVLRYALPALRCASRTGVGAPDALWR